MATEKVREYWSEVGAVGWVANQRLFDAELAAFGDAVLAAVDPAPAPAPAPVTASSTWAAAPARCWSWPSSAAGTGWRSGSP